jgi:MoaA/NifB/PqqE/SkfB family radical SAM enzyme
VITPKDDGNLDPLGLRADDEFLTRYWGEWYGSLHDGKLPPQSNHCASDGEANCGTGISGFTIDPYGNLLPCVALRRKICNVLEIADLTEVWRGSPVLAEIRRLNVEAARRLARRPDGKYYEFCLGVAETQTGDPLAIYPQVEINARAKKRHFELLQIGEGRAKTA